MKKQIQVLGLIASLVFLLGVIFKMLHLPGAAIIISLGVLTGIAFLITYLVKSTEVLTDGIEKTTSVVAAIVFILVLIGFLLKSLHLPGAGVILWISHAALIIACVFFFVDAFKESEPSKQSIKTLNSYMIFTFMAILLFIAVVLRN